jgi:hypothetical protein
MAKTFQITAPDGHVLEITGPDDATEEQAIAIAQQRYKPVTPSLMDSRRAASASEANQNRPDFEKPGYAPLKTVLDAPLDVGIGIERGLGLDPMRPISSIPDALRNLGADGGNGILGAVKKAVYDNPVGAVQRGGQAIREQNLPGAAQSVGEGVAAIAPLVAGSTRVLGKVPPSVAKATLVKALEGAGLYGGYKAVDKGWETLKNFFGF